MSTFFDHMSQFNRVEYTPNGRRILTLNTYPVEMALREIERFVVKILVKNLPEWHETQDAVALHAHGLRYGNEWTTERQLVLSSTARKLMDEEEIGIQRRLWDRLSKAMGAEESSYDCWLDRLRNWQVGH